MLIPKKVVKLITALSDSNCTRKIEAINIRHLV